MDVHIVNPAQSSRIVLRYEIKTEGGTKSRNQREADDILRWLGLQVNDVVVDLGKGRILVDGEKAARHFREVRRLIKQR